MIDYCKPFWFRFIRVRFKYDIIKGSPNEEKEELWTYKESKSGVIELVVVFREDHIRAIFYEGKPSYEKTISWIGIGDSYEQIIEKFGKPSMLSVSQDQLERLLSFEKYNVFYRLKENRVIAFGIYNKEYGDLEFKAALEKG